MKKILILFFSFFLLVSPSVFAEELLFHCNMENDSGSRNISIDKEGDFFISHESVQFFRKDETFLGLEVGAIKDSPIWIFGDDSGDTYDYVTIFNYKNLGYAATGFKKGEYKNAFDNLEQNYYFCFLLENPFQDL